MEEFENFLSEVTVLPGKLVIMGDFNFHMDKPHKSEVLGLFSVKDKVIQLKLNQVFKIYHGLSPDYLNFKFTRISSLHHYSIRGSPHNFTVPKVQGQVNNTFYSGIQHWNSLPNSVKQVNKFPNFKEAIKYIWMSRP